MSYFRKPVDDYKSPFHSIKGSYRSLRLILCLLIYEVHINKIKYRLIARV